MHYFLDPLKNHFADFSGRATRTQYWMYVLVAFLVTLAVALVEGVIFGSELLTNILSLVLLIPGVAIAARRLHDMGKSGWWQLLYFIPLIGWIAVLVMLCLPSQPDNQFGPATASADASSPKAEQA